MKEQILHYCFLRPVSEEKLKSLAPELQELYRIANSDDCISHDIVNELREKNPDLFCNIF